MSNIYMWLLVLLLKLKNAFAKDQNALQDFFGSLRCPKSTLNWTETYLRAITSPEITFTPHCAAPYMTLFSLVSKVHEIVLSIIFGWNNGIRKMTNSFNFLQSANMCVRMRRSSAISARGACFYSNLLCWKYSYFYFEISIRIILLII